MAGQPQSRAVLIGHRWLSRIKPPAQLLDLIEMRSLDLDPVTGSGAEDARNQVLMSFQTTRDEEAQPVLHDVNGNEIPCRAERRRITPPMDDRGCKSIDAGFKGMKSASGSLPAMCSR